MEAAAQVQIWMTEDHVIGLLGSPTDVMEFLGRESWFYLLGAERIAAQIVVQRGLVESAYVPGVPPPPPPSLAAIKASFVPRGTPLPSDHERCATWRSGLQRSRAARSCCG